MKRQVLCLTLAAQLAAGIAFAQIPQRTTRIYKIPAKEHKHEHAEEMILAEALVGFNEDSIRKALKAKGTEQWEIDLHVQVVKEDYADRKLKRGIYAEGTGRGQGITKMVMPPCTNLDFETGDFTGWSGAIGDNQTSSFGPLDNQIPGFVSNGTNAALGDATARHTIMDVLGGTDPCGGFPVVAPGGQYSVRLGGTTPNYQGEIMEQTFTVNSSSTNITYQYAVVLNDGGHAPADQPYFKIEVLDQNGQIIDTCVQYMVTAGGSVPGFVQCQPSVFYKPWTIVSIDLSAQIGNDVTIRFTVAGCTQSGHYGYAYIDAACSALAVSLNFCPGNPTVVLTAPSGFVGYQWLDGNGNPIAGATNQTYTIPNATVGTSFTAQMTSVTGCVTSLTFNLAYTLIYSPITTTNVDCWGAANGQLVTAGNSGVPPYTYLWSTGATSPTISALGPGMYTVTTTDSLGCQVIDTAFVTEPPRLDTSAITYTFCPGDPEVTFTAPQGYNLYQWYGPDGLPIAGATTNTITVTTGVTLGDEFSCVYSTPPGCEIYDSVIVGIIPPGIIYQADSVTNVFTPNGDFLNDIFYPFYDHTVAANVPVQPASAPAFDFTKMYIGTYELRVYDRWGREVFLSNQVDFGWNGQIRSDGKDATPGVYFWVAKMTSRCLEDQTPTEVTGFVHLIKN